MKRLGFKGAILILAFFLAGFTAYWAVGRTLIGNIFTHALKSSRKAGYPIVHKGLTLGGFPMTFTVNMATPSIQSAAGQTPISLKGERVEWRATALTPRTWQGRHIGDARIDMRGPGGTRWLFDARPFRVNAEAKLKLNGGLSRLRLTGFRLRPEAVIGTEPPINAVNELEIFITEATENTDIDLRIDEVFLNPATWPKLQSVFGPRIRALTVKAKAVGLKALDAETYHTWQKGGHFVSDDWQLNWDALNMSGTFDMTSGPDGMSGTIQIALDDEKRVIDAFVTADLITAGQAQQIGLAMMIMPSNEAGQKMVTLTLERGALMFLGQPIYQF